MKSPAQEICYEKILQTKAFEETARGLIPAMDFSISCQSDYSLKDNQLYYPKDSFT